MLRRNPYDLLTTHFHHRLKRRYFKQNNIRLIFQKNTIAPKFNQKMKMKITECRQEFGSFYWQPTVSRSPIKNTRMQQEKRNALQLPTTENVLPTGAHIADIEPEPLYYFSSLVDSQENKQRFILTNAQPHTLNLIVLIIIHNSYGSQLRAADLFVNH